MYKNSDLIAGLIKSIRGSDPDAALYYFAMANHGTDGKNMAYLASEILRTVSEDIGLADPQAVAMAASVAGAASCTQPDWVESALANVIIYAACAPKSDAVYKALQKAKQAAARSLDATVPDHICWDSASPLYKNPHDYPNHYVWQQYLPDMVSEHRFYDPTSQGYEAQITAHMTRLNQSEADRQRVAHNLSAPDVK